MRACLGLAVCLGVVLVVVGCGSEDKPATVNTSNSKPCEGKAITCEDGVATRCVDGETTDQDCSEDNKLCVPGMGCRLCVPGTGKCDGETTQVCSEDGKRLIDGEVCGGEPGEHCDVSSGVCVNLCEHAAATRNYIGCEYFPVSTANLVNKDFDYAVIVSNPQAVPAEVKIAAPKTDFSEAFEDSATIEAGGLKEFILPWRRTGEDDDTGLSDMAYRLTSTVPVSAYQFNPLQYRLDQECTGEDADDDPSDMACYSYTNDASLLLPSTALGISYVVVAPSTARSSQALTDDKGTSLWEDDAGMPVAPEFGMQSTVTVVATKDTKVTVLAKVDVVTEKGRFQAGDEITLELKEGQASQMHFLPPDSIEMCPGRSDEQTSPGFPCNGSASGVCKLQRAYCEGADPSGTRIRSDQPVAVYVGSPCSFIPYNRRACDHLEEMLPPLRTWGKDVIVGVTDPLANEPNIVRIVSAADGNVLKFDPADVHEGVTLDEGEAVEIEARESFRVTGSQPLLAAQYLVGLEDVGLDGLADAAVELRMSGDPSLSFAAPVEQYRRDFDFLTPSTYDSGFVTVVAPAEADVTVDGQYVASWEDIGKTGYKVGHHQLKPGTHRVRGTLPIAVQVYGFGAYTSYMFPAGLNLDQVNEVE